MVEDTAFLRIFNNVVVLLGILICEGELRHIVILVRHLRLRVGYYHLLAHYRSAVMEGDESHLVAPEQVIRPSSHFG